MLAAAVQEGTPPPTARMEVVKVLEPPPRQSSQLPTSDAFGRNHREPPRVLPQPPPVPSAPKRIPNNILTPTQPKRPTDDSPQSFQGTPRSTTTPRVVTATATPRSRSVTPRTGAHSPQSTTPRGRAAPTSLSFVRLPLRPAAALEHAVISTPSGEPFARSQVPPPHRGSLPGPPCNDGTTPRLRAVASALSAMSSARDEPTSQVSTVEEATQRITPRELPRTSGKAPPVPPPPSANEPVRTPPPLPSPPTPTVSPRSQATARVRLSAPPTPATCSPTNQKANELRPPPPPPPPREGQHCLHKRPDEPAATPPPTSSPPVEPISVGFASPAFRTRLDCATLSTREDTLNAWAPVLGKRTFLKTADIYRVCDRFRKQPLGPDSAGREGNPVIGKRLGLPGLAWVLDIDVSLATPIFELAAHANAAKTDSNHVVEGLREQYCDFRLVLVTMAGLTRTNVVDRMNFASLLLDDRVDADAAGDGVPLTQEQLVLILRANAQLLPASDARFAGGRLTLQTIEHRAKELLFMSSQASREAGGAGNAGETRTLSRKDFADLVRTNGGLLFLPEDCTPAGPSRIISRCPSVVGAPITSNVLDPALSDKLEAAQAEAGRNETKSAEARLVISRHLLAAETIGANDLMRAEEDPSARSSLGRECGEDLNFELPGLIPSLTPTVLTPSSSSLSGSVRSAAGKRHHAEDGEERLCDLAYHSRHSRISRSNRSSHSDDANEAPGTASTSAASSAAMARKARAAIKPLNLACITRGREAAAMPHCTLATVAVQTSNRELPCLDTGEVCSAGRAREHTKEAAPSVPQAIAIAVPAPCAPPPPLPADPLHIASVIHMSSISQHEYAIHKHRRVLLVFAAGFCQGLSSAQWRLCFVAFVFIVVGVVVLGLEVGGAGSKLLGVSGIVLAAFIAVGGLVALCYFLRVRATVATDADDEYDLEMRNDGPCHPNSPHSFVEAISHTADTPGFPKRSVYVTK